MDQTYDLATNEEYALCLFKASKSKAQVNAVLSSMGFSNLTTLIDLKLEASRNVINDQIEKGLFPIVGYSYFEYSNNLKEFDASSSLLYSEYALELSKLDSYFKEKQSSINLSTTDKKLILMLVIGLVFGFVCGLLVKRKN